MLWFEVQSKSGRTGQFICFKDGIRCNQHDDFKAKENPNFKLTKLAMLDIFADIHFDTFSFSLILLEWHNGRLVKTDLWS